jgi:hypothetical protein
LDDENVLKLIMGLTGQPVSCLESVGLYILNGGSSKDQNANRNMDSESQAHEFQMEM